MYKSDKMIIKPVNPTTYCASYLNEEELLRWLSEVKTK